MRLVLAVFLLAAACGPKPAAGPAWPKQAERETDGGESIAPRARASVLAAAEADDGDQAVAAPADKAEAKPEARSDALPALPSAAPELDDIVITTEDLVIEIDD